MLSGVIRARLRVPSRGDVKNTPLRERKGERGWEGKEGGRERKEGGGEGGREGGEGGRGGREGKVGEENGKQTTSTLITIWEAYYICAVINPC